MEYTLKKTLGQHFLNDAFIIQKIIHCVSDSNTGTNQLLEIGPGAGALTNNLLQLQDIDFKAVEIDHEKVVYLQKKFPALKEKLFEKIIDFFNKHML